MILVKLTTMKIIIRIIMILITTTKMKTMMMLVAMMVGMMVMIMMTMLIKGHRCDGGDRDIYFKFTVYMNNISPC